MRRSKCEDEQPRVIGVRVYPQQLQAIDRMVALERFQSGDAVSRAAIIRGMIADTIQRQGAAR